MALYVLMHIFFDSLFAIWIMQGGGLLHGEAYQKAILPWLIFSIVLNLVGFIAVRRVQFVHLGFWFVLLSIAFMFGNVFLDAFGLETSLAWDPSIFYSEQEKYTASLYALFCINAMALGGIVVSSELNVMEEVSLKCGMRLKKTGIVCTVVGFLASAFQSIQLISVTQASGTYEAYSTAYTSVIIDDLSYLFVAGVVAVIASGTVRRRTSFLLAIFSCAYYIAVMSLSGSRKFAVFAVLAIALSYLWVYRDKGLSAKKILVTAVIGVLVLNLLYVIREHRTELETILPSYFDSLSSFNFLGLLGEVFAETGLTFYSVVGIIVTVPSVFPFELGGTFLRSLFSFLPIGWLMGDFFQEAASTQVVNVYTGLPVGASMIGDFYWNWGFIGGVLASFVFGMALSIVTKRLLGKRSTVPVYFSVLFIVLVGVRAGIFEIYRPLVMIVVLPMLVSLIVNRESEKKMWGSDV